LLVSRGIVEAEHNHQEFGLEGAKKSFQGASALTARNLCLAILESAEQFLREVGPAHNDVTALVLLRYLKHRPE
jgi:serine phosphatase RsbU (regulator of sigma subunit)